ncbi:MAG TPA: type II CRISPR-associated endonuclease Cas1 [Bacteroidia bacterium]|jgi:CRISPR-associated protein Cas1
MIKRTLYFGNPSYLSLGNGQLVLRLPEVEKNDTLPEHYKKEVSASIPVEDIGIVVLDHKQITITQALMEALLENNTALITCDSTHHPTGLMLPLCGNTIQNERFRSQLDATEPLKKQLWAQTISQKIRNQADHFTERKLNNSYLVPLYRNVKSGDSDNAEATAAAHYWGTVFANLIAPDGNLAVSDFKRFREGLPPNNYLNYGYAILRATMARSIVGAGLLPTLGIFHHNRYNAYCLADDLMEPYRPYVDKVVCNIIEEHGITADLPKEVKAVLLKIPSMDVMIDGEKSPLMNATQRTAVSLVKCFNGEQRKLLYPEFC